MIRHRLSCSGTVQGVGFRPAVHRLAHELALTGTVRNGVDGAEIEVEGDEIAVKEFERRLATALPGLARLAEVVVTTATPKGGSEFVVVTSAAGRRRHALIPPDARLCGACRAEMEDPGDRRVQYAFTTCTECGPRFSLVRSLPYDRAQTSMAPFPLCATCAAEYGDLSDRRYHAEPLCCPDCGPVLRLLDRTGAEVCPSGEAFGRIREALTTGAIVAVKGLGGYQLACRADDEGAVSWLRHQKNRPRQPFAVMARDVAVAHSLVQLSAADVALLESPESPILLAPRRNGALLTRSIAPHLSDVGVMLPTTPLHVELFREAPYEALVMTSGNARHEPIARTDEDALRELATFADLFLVHDREVVRRVDDSVVRSCGDAPFLVRRSRGYVPRTLPVPHETPIPILGVGGHLQTTACLAVGRVAIPSQHVGDLDTCAAREFLEEVANQLEEFLETSAEVIVIDEHPDYPSAWFGERLAEARGVRLMRVQHHLAHAGAVLAENAAWPRSANDRACALVLDGTGYGGDGATWGCEWLSIAGDLKWRRLASADALTLVGGERAVSEPWRIAMATLIESGESELLFQVRPEWEQRARSLKQLLERGRWPRARGAGRLFEAAGALFGLGEVNSWEGQSAAYFEALAEASKLPASRWREVSLAQDSLELPGKSLLVAAARRLSRNADPAHTALGFHRTFAALAAELSSRAFGSQARLVALGGGCLVNRHLRRFLQEEHGRHGLGVLLPREVPAGDGGLAYGQVALATAALHRRVSPSYEGAF